MKSGKPLVFIIIVILLMLAAYIAGWQLAEKSK
jgi:hypothetical protein